MTPTTEGKQLAAQWRDAYHSTRPAYAPDQFVIIATEHLALKAQFEEALADLREIDALLENAPDSPSVIADAKAIAAKWRVETDPLLEAMSVAMCGVAGEDYTESAKALRAELSKRGYEIGGKS